MAEATDAEFFRLVYGRDPTSPEEFQFFITILASRRTAPNQSTHPISLDVIHGDLQALGMKIDGLTTSMTTNVEALGMKIDALTTSMTTNVEALGMKIDALTTNVDALTINMNRISIVMLFSVCVFGYLATVKK